MGSQRVRHDLANKQQWQIIDVNPLIYGKDCTPILFGKMTFLGFVFMGKIT